MGQKDSAWIYVQKSLPYIKTVGQKDRAVFLYMIGENCHRNNENRLAKHYLALSCKAFPTSSAYNLLASIYNQEGKKATARALWKKAMEKASLTDKIQNRQTSLMFEGHSLYEAICANKSIVKWGKADVAKLIEYYKVVNLPFVTQLDTDYEGLTNGNKLFLILQDMGKSDEEMTRILGTSYGALRTTRSRIKGKLKDKEQ